jgi:integrase/recombinase XerD
VGIELLLNTAARRTDVYLLGRQHHKNGRLTWRPAKTRRSTGTILTIPVLPELQAALDAMPAANGELTFLLNERSKPFKSAAAFGNRFAAWCRQAGLEPQNCDDGKIRSFRAHGLRKAALKQLAHAGCTASELQAISGHATLRQLEDYLREVEQEKLAEAATAKRLATQEVKPETPTYKPSDPSLQNGS